MKVDELVKCPHCAKEEYYIFHDNAEMLMCSNCAKPMDIKLKYKIEVVASKPIRICCICNEEFLSNSSHEDNIACPKCGYKTYNYNIK